MTGYIYHLAIAADQFFNAMLGGYADETLSSRIWRNNQAKVPKRRWIVSLRLVNGLFWWQPNHCKASWQAERMRRHMPADFKPTQPSL